MQYRNALPMILMFALIASTADGRERNPCAKGKLKRWAKKAGYSAEICTQPQPAPNTAPVITILSPSSATQYQEGSAIALSATAYDAEDGDLSSHLSWQPAAPEGSLLLSPGQYTLVATSTDSQGLSTTEQVTITVTEMPAALGSADLSWSIPTAREDGTPLSPSELAGYEIYAVHEESDTEQIITISDPMAVSYTVPDLPPGTHYFAISAMDSDGLTSEMSDIVTKTID